MSAKTENTLRYTCYSCYIYCSAIYSDTEGHTAAAAAAVVVAVVVAVAPAAVAVTVAVAVAIVGGVVSVATRRRFRGLSRVAFHFRGAG